MDEPKWTVRKRQWPNGRVYWIVMRGQAQVVVGKSGGESKFYDRAQAQSVADDMNGVAKKEDCPVLDD